MPIYMSWKKFIVYSRTITRFPWSITARRRTLSGLISDIMMFQKIHVERSMKQLHYHSYDVSPSNRVYHCFTEKPMNGLRL